MSLVQLVQSMEEPATEDLRAVKLLPTILRALGNPPSARLRDAISLLERWRLAGGHRRDLDTNGHYENTRAVTLMDAWWPKLVRAQFAPTLGNQLYGRVQGLLSLGDHTRADPNAPDFFDGWWGYVSKDLRGLFGPRPARWLEQDLLRRR